MCRNKKKQKRTQASQIWPKWSDTALHSIPKSVWRIGSSKGWVRSNLATLKPRSLVTSRSLPYEWWRQTSSLSKVGLEVELSLSVSSKAYKVPTSAIATLSASFFLGNSAWRWQKANCGLLGLSASPYSKLKVEWMKDLASNNLSAKSSAC